MDMGHHGNRLLIEAVKHVGPSAICHASCQESDNFFVLDDHHADLRLVLAVIPREWVFLFSSGEPLDDQRSILGIDIHVFPKAAHVFEDGSHEPGPKGGVHPFVILTVPHGCCQPEEPAGISER
jgi:hypothetical protein